MIKAISIIHDEKDRNYPTIDNSKFHWQNTNYYAKSKSKDELNGLRKTLNNPIRKLRY